MRLDKYLKVSRLIKRRSVAAESCTQGRIEVNGKVAKPSVDVKVGDEITLKFGERILRVQITTISEHALKADAAEMYRVLPE